jgi:tryptophan-rich sensory protein
MPSLLDLYRPAAVALLLPVVGGIVSSAWNRLAVRTWYRQIRKPRYTPPNVVFGVLWPTAYLALGYACYRFTRALSLRPDLNSATTQRTTTSDTSTGITVPNIPFLPRRQQATVTPPPPSLISSLISSLSDPRNALAVYTAQLALNFLYSPLFFGMQMFGWAFVDVSACALVSGWTSYLFYQVDGFAGGLMAAYTTAICAASYFCGYIWWYNPVYKDKRALKGGYGCIHGDDDEDEGVEE